MGEVSRGQKITTCLKGEINALHARLSQEGINHQKEIETLSSTLKTQINDMKNKTRDMANVFANMAMGIGSVKYHDDYEIGHMSGKEGRFIDALRNYAQTWLKNFGHPDLAEEVRAKVSVSKGIQDHINELEPKKQISRGLSR